MWLGLMFSGGQLDDDNLMLKLSKVSTVIMCSLQWAMQNCAGFAVPGMHTVLP